MENTPALKLLLPFYSVSVNGCGGGCVYAPGWRRICPQEHVVQPVHVYAWWYLAMPVLLIAKQLQVLLLLRSSLQQRNLSGLSTSLCGDALLLTGYTHAPYVHYLRILWLVCLRHCSGDAPLSGDMPRMFMCLCLVGNWCDLLPTGLLLLLLVPLRHPCSRLSTTYDRGNRGGSAIVYIACW